MPEKSCGMIGRTERVKLDWGLGELGEKHPFSLKVPYRESPYARQFVLDLYFTQLTQVSPYFFT